MLQLQSPECVSEVLSMREREGANLGSDGVLIDKAWISKLSLLEFKYSK